MSQELTTTVVEAKQAARQSALARRDAAHAAGAATAPARVAAHLAAAFHFPSAAVVSGYWPGRSELDIRPLMAALHAEGHRVALPVVMGRGKPLIFRAWQPGAALEAKAFGLCEPAASAAELTPQVLLVPFLAFDGEGYRIGYGAGYYDMTLAALRAQREVLAIGVGYAAQRVARLPHDERDEKLDWVVTEEGAVPFARAARGATGVVR
ncbi:MAG: 5-formyltetrahydrofolate cyclo-ligase [Alphaproteobacteria bacterium]